ncbi:MAG TPA: anhydro-N-acetylmuramic acid kinase [Bacteroidales bacterium]|nr:anhydro-N-acetylmuramic acid kinase [Bacteroidales bacterium]
MKIYHCVGVMSGTSLDGLDIALCEFERVKHTWHYNILKASTIPYNADWKNKLSGAGNLSGFELVKLDKEYGAFIGEQINHMLADDVKFNVSFIASHGHTVFHRPDMGVNLQIGNGSVIAAQTGLPTVTNFRDLDIALGGQGAPLVPYGDEQLFGDYYYCLNLGGFANISFRYKQKRIAYDIGPANIVLNYLSKKTGKDFDYGGNIARNAAFDPELFVQLNSLDFYMQPYPKSLGKEWLDDVFIPVLDGSSVADDIKIRTCTEHIAAQIGKSLNSRGRKKVLVTGGGAYNSFLIELINKYTLHEILIPENGLVEYKEALIFAFLGMLRIRNEINTLASVTGAKFNHSGGIVCHP